MKLVKLITLLIAIIAAWIYFGDDQKVPPQPKNMPPKQQPAQTASTPLSPSFGSDAPLPAKVENIPAIWPPITDNSNGVAADLTARNFYVIFDSSGSMQDKQCYGEGSKIDVAKTALANFARLVPERANLGLSIFMNSVISEPVQLGQANRDTFIAAVNAATPSGGTPLATAIISGYRKLTAQASKQLGYGEYTLVVMTDGIPSKGEDPTAIVHAILERTPIEIHTIGFCIGENHTLNIPGRTVYKAANSQEDLQRGLEAVLAESAIFDISDFNAPQ